MAAPRWVEGTDPDEVGTAGAEGDEFCHWLSCPLAMTMLESRERPLARLVEAALEFRDRPLSL